MPVRLRPMTEAEYAIYREYAVGEYAKDKISAGNWKAEEALQHANAEFSRSMPSGGNFLYIIEDANHEQRVGVLWLAVEPSGNGFIYDFEIDKAFQRQGYATQALAELENVAREKGIEKIGLHVFGHNQAARALYQKVGYIETNVNMSKKI
jgi:ribosomal protein S18 acetylase RimI-like enzyme